MGPDGHTASLFPGLPLENSASVWVTYLDNSPKPPPSRITLTLHVINNAKFNLIVLSGESKRDMIKEILNARDAGK